jgi:plastocyanin
MPNSSRRSSSSILVRARSIAALAAVCAGAAHAAGHTVTMDGVKFEPATITVAPGDTVTWINKDPFPHTATAAGVFDSREIAPGKSWKWTARKAGVYDYVCTLHPTMKGTITVQ